MNQSAWSRRSSPRVGRDPLDLRILSIDEVKRILRVASEKSQRNALALKLIAFYGFKLHDLVGSPSRRMENKKWVAMEPNRPGMQIEDLSHDGILLRRKGEEDEKRPLKPELVRELRECIGKRVRGKILDTTDSRLLQLRKEYAKEARISDWKRYALTCLTTSTRGIKLTYRN